MDKHYNDDHGQIPESAQFIPDSTLIPQSEQMYPEADAGDHHGSYGDGGLPGGNGRGVETFEGKRPSFMMKNLPLIVVLLLGTGIGGSFLYKKVLHPSAVPIAVAVSQPASTVAEQPIMHPVEARPTTDITAPIAADPKPQAIVQSASVAQPTPVMQPEPAKQNPPKVDVAAPVQKVEMPVAATVTAPVKPQVPAVAAEPMVDTRSARELEFERRRSEALKAELAAMQARMAALESELHNNKSAPAATAVVSTNGQAGAVEHAHHAKHKARVQAAKKPAPERVNGYSVTAVRNGLAWVTTPDGLVTVREGDTVPGVGRVTKINEGAGRVSVGNKFVQ